MNQLAVTMERHSETFLTIVLPSLMPRPYPSVREKGLVKNDNISGPETGILESQYDRNICN